MSSIRINNDIESFRSDFFKGLSLRECIFGGAGITAGIAVVAILTIYAHVPVDAATFFGIPVAAPIILSGFVKVNGMHLSEYVMRMISVRRAKPLVYHTQTEMIRLSKLPGKKKKDGGTFMTEAARAERASALLKTEEMLKKTMEDGNDKS